MDNSIRSPAATVRCSTSMGFIGTGLLSFKFRSAPATRKLLKIKLISRRTIPICKAAS